MRFLGTSLRPKSFLRELRFAWATLLDRQDADRRLFLSVTDDPALSRKFALLADEVPQASLVNASGSLVRANLDWRAYFASRLSGHGLEIGPLHKPLLYNSGTSVDYVDRFSVDELRREYPELASSDLVEPTIITDAESLSDVPTGSYDFLVAAHVLEHMRNPICALDNWARVLRAGGLLYLIVPDKRVTFDRRRPRTLLEHLIADYRRPSVERDYEHYIDYAVHVHHASTQSAVAEADRLAQANYSIHFHVFIPDDIVRLLEWVRQNVCPIQVEEGPAAEPDGDEFHLLIRCNMG